MKMNKILYMIAAGTAMASLSGCDKFLDVMPDNRAEINSVEKIRSLLVSAYPTSTYLLFNEWMSDNVENLGGDIVDSYIPRSLDEFYTWSEPKESSNDSPKEYWDACYGAIASANEAINAINGLGGAENGLQAEMAEALLCRAYAHFMLVNEFCQNYNELTSDKDLGIPYMDHAETELNPQYERGTVAEVYQKIEKDLEYALVHVSDSYYSVPKYHFNQKAAYAFAARFYLFYEKWDKAVTYATKCLGSQPGAVLRNWAYRGTLETDRTVQGNDFVNASYDSNLLLLTAYSLFGRIAPYPSCPKYAHTVYLACTEDFYAKNFWSSNNGVSNRFLYNNPTHYYSGNGFSQLALWKIVEFFEYTDKVAGIGYAHVVYPAFTTDETLLTRAEAYTMLGEYDLAAADLDTWAHNVIKTSSWSGTITPEAVKQLYDSIEYATWDAPTTKKHLNPSFNIGEEGGIKESMLQCCLVFKKIENGAQGLRWFDVKRYGIEIWRRTLESDPTDSSLGGYKPSACTDVLKKDDLRRAIQLPQEVIAAGLEPNPR